MTGPNILIAATSLVAGATWVTVFRPSVDEIALVVLCGLCAVLSTF